MSAYRSQTGQGVKGRQGIVDGLETNKERDCNEDQDGLVDKKSEPCRDRRLRLERDIKILISENNLAVNGDKFYVHLPLDSLTHNTQLDFKD